MPEFSRPLIHPALPRGVWSTLGLRGDLPDVCEMRVSLEYMDGDVERIKLLRTDVFVSLSVKENNR